MPRVSSAQYLGQRALSWPGPAAAATRAQIQSRPIISLSDGSDCTGGNDRPDGLIPARRQVACWLCGHPTLTSRNSHMPHVRSREGRVGGWESGLEDGGRAGTGRGHRHPDAVAPGRQAPPDSLTQNGVAALATLAGSLACLLVVSGDTANIRGGPDLAWPGFPGPGTRSTDAGQPTFQPVATVIQL